MKTHGKFAYKPGSHSERKQEGAAQAPEFHNRRINAERRIESSMGSPNKPQGTDEYQQFVAESTRFNANLMIEEAAFFIAERHGFAPGAE